MIVFNLSCGAGHHFEGWFGSSDDFSSQMERRLIACPECGLTDVTKAPMAPAVGKKSNSASRSAPERVEGADRRAEAHAGGGDVIAPLSNVPMPPEVIKAVQRLAKAQAKALKGSTWVGKDFAEKSRAMHYGEENTASIHGEATPEQAQDLLDEGVSVAALPFPVAPPEDLN